jgi:hypothetical protein
VTDGEVQQPNMLHANESHSGPIFIDGNRSLSITIEYYIRIQRFDAVACE